MISVSRLRTFLGLGVSFALISCGGGSSPKLAPVVADLPPVAEPAPVEFVVTDGLFKNTFEDNFKVGAAIVSDYLVDTAPEKAILDSQFNAISGEFEMKPNIIAPQEGVYNFGPTDAMVDYAEANGYEIRFHALLWHISTPDYFYEGTPDEVRTRLETYITDVMTRYKGRIKYWDVVNEVVTEDIDAADPYRRSEWYEAAGGPQYIDWAFNAARAADPDAILFINDYGTRFPEKRDQYIEIIADLTARDIPLDGVGHQFHLNDDTVAANVFASLDAVDNLFANLINHVTELDISVYNDPGSCWAEEVGCDADYGETLPASVANAQTQLIQDLFRGFVQRPSVDLVQFWGVGDANSWLNTTPTTRTNYPLMFDRDFEAKNWLQAVVDPNYVVGQD